MAVMPEAHKQRVEQKSKGGLVAPTPDKAQLVEPVGTKGEGGIANTASDAPRKHLPPAWFFSPEGLE